ncbi:kinase-like protein [Sistotremastrum suecicum HHB10207 ss-3]|uniref:Kinase-like protein n=1 Tax=Sistotremastrum suecicum HHB10207 ss-3 TaxID=1314776 RepID=A0A166CTQ0_9AGAM|nr:kinase-like protein [Sistotremastrum suecicum HHB10207 ss-3]
MSTWSKLKHDNILPLLGFFFSSSLSVSLVTPWMEQGDAPNYLKGHPHTCRVNLLLGITKGLAYIHSQGLYHGDLKGGNILISDEGRPMLSSFTRTTSHNLSFIESNTPTRIRLGTTRWMAPEVIMESAPGVTPKSDMWALGCVFLELIASILPYHHCQNVNQLILTLIADQYPYPQASLTSEPLPFKQYPGLWSVCIRCWDFTPSSRPQCQDIQGLLTWLKSVLFARTVRFNMSTHKNADI